MDIDSILVPFQSFGVHLGLDRIHKLLANLGNPHHQVPVIHVAGTNGKGSVCAYLSSILTEAGYRTGRYISPHLVDWTERICINEQPISTEELCQLLLKVQAAISSEEDSPTLFETLTAAAWLYFAQQQVEVAVVEVGLGGRLDATNVCSQPIVTVITSISREHWQQLGPTIADIAREKAGILKQGCPVVVGSLPPDAEKVVRSRALELQCPIFLPHPAREITKGWAEYPTIQNSIIPTPHSPFPTPHSENPKSIKYPLPLQGQIQLTNSALAIAALEILQQQGWQITEEAIVQGMAKTQWLGRMQWTTWQNHKLLIDGAHNPAAAEVLRNYIDNLDAVDDVESERRADTLEDTVIRRVGDRERKNFPLSPRLNVPASSSPVSSSTQHSVSWVMGMLCTKDHADIFKALLRPKDTLYLVPVPDDSSAKPGELAKLAGEVCPELSFCRTYPDLASGLEAAFTETENLVVLCGSLYLVGHFLRMGSEE